MAKRRRANSEGSIYQRKDGTWEAKITLTDGKRKSIYARTQGALLAKLQDVRKRMADGLPPSPAKLTVKQWLETWLRDSVAHSVRPRTAHRYAEIVRYHLIPHLGHIKLSRLTPSDVERMISKVLEDGQSPQSAAHHRAVLRTSLNHAMRHSLVGRNAAALAGAPYVPEREHDAISPDKARAILQAVKGDKLEALYLLLLSTGLREGEALGLRWDDVSLEDGTASIQRILQRLDGEWTFPEPKTKRSRRTVSLPGPVVAVLDRHQAHQLEERLWLGPAWEGGKWEHLVFTNELGGPLHSTTVLHRFQKLLERAGLPRMRIHDLRHGAASLMAVMGIPPRVAMELLGHSQIATTMNVYAHVAPEYGKEAMERVSKVLWGE